LGVEPQRRKIEKNNTLVSADYLSGRQLASEKPSFLRREVVRALSGAAALSTPMAAVVFSLEEVMGDLTPDFSY